MITILSFAVFWTDTSSADALGFGVGVIVVNLLANVVLLEMLPVCGELIWIDIFALLNTVTNTSATVVSNPTDEGAA